MSKSISAKIVSDLLKLWPKRTPEVSERRFAELLREGEKPTPPLRTIATRHEYSANGCVFYINEKSESNYVVFYIHGGAYVYDREWERIEIADGDGNIASTNAVVTE